MPAMTMCVFQNRQGGCTFLAGNGNIEKNDCCLKDIHTNNLLDQVPLANHCVETDHHQYYIEPVIVFTNNKIKHYIFLIFCVAFLGVKYMPFQQKKLQLSPLKYHNPYNQLRQM